MFDQETPQNSGDKWLEVMTSEDVGDTVTGDTVTPIVDDSDSFPFQAYKNTLVGDIAEYCHKAFKAPFSATCMIAHGLLASLHGRMIKVRGAFPADSYINVYVCVAAESGRWKSVVLGFCQKPLVKWASGRHKQWLANEGQRKSKIDALEESIKKDEADADPDGWKHYTDHHDYQYASDNRSQTQKDADELRELKEGVHSCPPIPLVSDATPEAIERHSKSQGGIMTIVTDEASKIWGIMKGRYRSGGPPDFSTWNTMWSTGPLSIIRADKDKPPLFTSEMTGSMILTTQPSVLDDMMSDDAFVGQGFLSRMLIQKPLSERVFDDGKEVEAPTELIHRLEAYVFNVLSKRYNGKDPKENETIIMCSPEAKEVFRKFSNDLERETFYHGDIKQFARRGREHAIRLAGFLASIKELQIITEALAKDARDLVLWHWRQIEEGYDETRDIAVNAVAEDVKEYITYNGGEMPSRQLYRKMHIDKKAVLELLDEGHLEGCSMWKDGQSVNIGWTELMPKGTELISPLPEEKGDSLG